MQSFKKYWPIFLIIVGLLIVGGAAYFVLGRGSSDEIIDEEEQVAEIPADMRPTASLTPTEDGHYLNLRISDIRIEAASLDYEILYQTAAGITQGVPGTAMLTGDSVEREILLGSESSGKFRYDEGVQEGTLTLRFRNEKGKLVGKLSTQWHLQNDTNKISSADDNFGFSLEESSDAWFVTMQTFGPYKQGVDSTPYGVFSSDPNLSGEVDLSGVVYKWMDGSWGEISGPTTPGIFISE